MDLKKFLKQLKLNENNISMILGGLVIVVVGLIIVNYFKKVSPTPTIPTGGNTNEEITLPTKHTVVAGETLWSIAEKYFKSGYNWVDIQSANKLANASDIKAGQVLDIPKVDVKTATIVSPTPEALATPSVKPTTTPTATVEATPTSSGAPTTKGGLPVEATQVDDTYTVVRGDSLWTIAVKVYGDGYQWTKIANANKLARPSLIHAGNVLSIPAK